MSERYVIQWKSKINGRAGRGTKLFGREEAERLATELNREYPNIEHEIVGYTGPGPGTPPESSSQSDESESSGEAVVRTE